MIQKIADKLYPWVLCVFFLHICFVSLFGVKLFGFRFFANQTSSMKPAIKPGDLLIVFKENQYAYLPGDIITFSSWENRKESIITHRIVRIGGNVYVTKGDANEAIDSQPALPRLIIGRVLFSAPFLGNYILISKTPVGLALSVFLPALLIITKELIVICSLLTRKKSVR